MLGGLVGARRSTVTLALRKLADRGSLVSQGNGWLIVEAPATPVRPEGKTPQLLLTAEEGSLTAARDPVGPDPEALRSLVSHFAQEREGFAQRTHRTRELAEKARALREEAQRLRRERGHEP